MNRITEKGPEFMTEVLFILQMHHKSHDRSWIGYTNLMDPFLLHYQPKQSTSEWEIPQNETIHLKLFDAPF